jgi:hypothetical protein
MSRPRSISTGLLAVLTPLLLLFATVSTWVHFEVTAPEALGSHVRESLREPEVRDELADEITRRVTLADSRLFAAAPVVRQAAEILITSRQFADVFEIAVQQVRRAVIEGREVSGTRLSDLETQLRQTLEVIDPSIAAQVPSDWDTSVVDLTEDAPVPRALRAAESIGRFWWLWCVVAAAAAVGWIACSYHRRRALAGLGVAIAGCGLALVVARRVVGDAFAEEVGVSTRAALRAVYDVTTSGIHDLGIAYLAAGGLIVAATVTGPVVSTLLQSASRRFETVMRMPGDARLRAAWGLGAAAVGALLAFAAARIGPVVSVVAGAALGFAGINVLAQALPSRLPERRTVSLRRVVAFGTIAAVLAVVVVTERGGGPPARSAVEVGPQTLVCNGYAELCNRRLDEVTFAGTHNSMSSSEDGYLLAEQTLSIGRQLETGARLLMLDTHYGIPTSTGLVLTDFVFNDRAALVERYGEATVANIERLRATVVQPSAPPSVYLCHVFCELGATPASAVFASIRDFLARNPSEVIVLMIQDETERDDTVRSLQAAGLDDLAYAKRPDEPWPTLGDLVRAGTPLVVLSQREGGSPDWFMPMFSLVQDTPYNTRTFDDLSCRANRGPTSAELFLLNHWIARSTPTIADARLMNDRDFLLERVDECADERDQRVNFIGVNFWGVGDVPQVVAELNDVAG